ncbi:SDR family NAD(P)-dependent oxidoreductase [soil metagenome]
MRRDVRGRVVLVTGASRGIGRRVAMRLAERGARLAIAARSADELAKLAADLKHTGAEIAVFTVDLTSPAARAKLIEDVVARFGGLDILCNCAGVCSFGEFSTSREEINRQVLEINFFAPVELIRLAVPHLTKSRQGGYRPAVLNLASICGRCGIPSMSEHCGSKHAFVGLTEALRGELCRFGIDVLLVLPGVVRSDDLNRHLLRNEGKIYLNFDGAQTSESVAESVMRSLERNRTEAASGFVSWWVWFGKRFWPRGVRRVMHRKVWRYAARNPG